MQNYAFGEGQNKTSLCCLKTSANCLQIDETMGMDNNRDFPNQDGIGNNVNIGIRKQKIPVTPSKY